MLVRALLTFGLVAQTLAQDPFTLAKDSNGYMTAAIDQINH